MENSIEVAKHMQVYVTKPMRQKYTGDKFNSYTINEDGTICQKQ